MHGTTRPATANGGLRFSPDAALRLGCPRGLVETAKQLGLPCTAPPPRAPGGIWSVEITSPEDEERLHEDTSRRRRDLGLPPIATCSVGAPSRRWMPRTRWLPIASLWTSTRIREQRSSRAGAPGAAASRGHMRWKRASTASRLPRFITRGGRRSFTCRDCARLVPVPAVPLPAAPPGSELVKTPARETENLSRPAP